MKKAGYFSLLVAGFACGQVCPSDIVITTADYSTDITQSNTFITINSSININNNVKLDADPVDGYVLMSPGFIAAPSSSGEFVAQALEGCGRISSQKMDVVLTNDIQNKKIDIYPNPVDEIINISFTQKNDTEFIFLLYDNSGKLVFNKKMEVGASIYPVTLHNLVSGSYIYKIISTKYLKTGIVLKK